MKISRRVKTDKIAAKVKEQLEERKKQAQSYHLMKEIAVLKKNYVSDYVTFKFFLARTNMMADQLNSNKIIEKVDGAPKSKEYMSAEFLMSKNRARKCHMGVYFKRNALLKRGVTEEELKKLIDDAYDLPVVNEKYDEEYNGTVGKAEFVKTD